MKAKVIHRFADKYTGEVYPAGKVLEITEERYNEIMTVGKFVFRIAQDDVSNDSTENANVLSNDAEETPTRDSITPDDGFDIMSVRELKEYAEVKYKLTFKAGMKKTEIIAELRRMEYGH